MKYKLCVLFFFFSIASSYACPLEPELERGDAVWRLNPSLGIVVRFIIGDKYTYYAHPEIGPPGSNADCIPHPKGGCKGIVVFRERREVVFIDGNSYHVATLIPIMCRVSDENWQSFYKINHRGQDASEP